MFTLFLTYRLPDAPAARVSAADEARIASVLSDAGGLSRALLYTPETAHDPYLDDGPPPNLALQLYFADVAALEAACAETGALQALAAPGRLPSLAGADVTQQAMLVRRYPVAEEAPVPEPSCTYLVAYTGTAEDLNLWLAYYIAHHPPIMRRFPGIRAIEICTRIDATGFLPFRRVDYMQRNKVVFDSAAALNAALNSPVRDEMRADFHKFPAYHGGNTHFPMLTRTIVRFGGTR
jgi:uncharacterized protein (TIGR02118 family)